jgi:hypothetical protein
VCLLADAPRMWPLARILPGLGMRGVMMGTIDHA